nr:hypothetical protein [Pararhizobium sp. IMCC21322]
MKLRVARIALQIIKYHDIFLGGVCIEIGQKRNHAWAFQKITASTHIIRKHSFNVAANCVRMLPAPMLLALKTAAFHCLFFGGYPAIDQRRIGF